MLSGAPGAGRRAQPEIASEIEIKFFFTGPGGDTWLSSWGRMGRSRQGARRQGPGPGALAFIRVCGRVLWGPQSRACWSFNPKVPGSGKPRGCTREGLDRRRLLTRTVGGIMVSVGCCLGYVLA